MVPPFLEPTVHSVMFSLGTSSRSRNPWGFSSLGISTACLGVGQLFLLTWFGFVFPMRQKAPQGRVCGLSLL